MSEILEIKSKIKEASVAEKKAADEPKTPVATVMGEHVARPQVLSGKTYAVESDKAKYYITINDIILDEGTEFQTRRPYEMFIASKDTTSYAWFTTLSRTISAVMRKGGDITFLIDEFKSIRDPEGGYWSLGKYMGSLQAHIGAVLEQHFRKIGLLDAEQAEIPQEKEENETHQPVTGQQCPKCFEFTYIMQEGCATCTNCQYSKCG